MMINSDSLISLLKDFYSKVEPISETVIHCERMVGDYVYQHYFFDYSDMFLSYNLDSYLKQHISSYYFKNNNALQWNFYIVFITEQEIRDVDRSTIEENMDYARKFIIPSKELDAWLKRIYLTKINNVNKNLFGLSDIWKRILKEQKLDCVFSSNIKITEGIDLIVEGKYFIQKDNHKTNRQFKENEISLGQLEWLNPIIYREYPKFSEPFTFKKINLIDGANGHGKTSLLESIELFITGENHRLEEGDDNCNIEARFTGDESSRKFKKDPSLFRERDRVWYNGMDKLRGSNLALNFNKFNFYNTDAAFRLTVNKNEKEIEGAFRDIALGDEVNFLRRQINAYQSKLETEQRFYEKTIIQCNEDIKEAQLLLTELHKPFDNKDRLVESLYQKIQHYNIRINLIGSDLVSLDKLKFNLSGLMSTLDSIVIDLPWLEENTLEELMEQNNVLKVLNFKIDIFNEGEIQFAKDINNLKIQQNTIKQSEDNLNEITTYFAEGAYLKLEGHHERIKDQRTKLFNLTAIESSYVSLQASSFPYPEKSIEENRKKLLEEQTKDRDALEQIEIELERSKKNISQVKALLATIKNEGRKYISLISDTNVCPFCNSSFESSSQLQNSILRSLEENIENEDFKGLLAVKSRLEESKNVNDLNLNALHVLLKLCKNNGLEPMLPLSLVRNQIDEILNTIPEEQRILNEMEHFSKICSKLNLEEGRLRLLKLRFKELFPNEKLDKPTIDHLNQNISIISGLNIDKLEEIDRILAGKSAELLAEFRHYDPRFTLDDKEVLKKRFEFVEHYLIELQSLSNIDFDESKNFNQLRIELKVIMDQIDEIRSGFNLQQKESGLSSKANETISEKKIQKDIAETKKKRIDAALEVLNLLEKDHSEDNFLQEFLKKNKQEIKETFLAIHTPKEFIDITISNGSIKLHKKNGTISNLMRISTGQRSALALSLFLTLNNKLTNGPNMLLFDDPISFTDDMNILSFLDYLREIVISKHTQIFFATANENLSFLFSKKFELLGDDFKHITLERQE